MIQVFCLNHLGSINLNFLHLLLSKLLDVFENLPNFTKFTVGTTLLKERRTNQIKQFNLEYKVGTVMSDYEQ
jgi:hypothetical protein